MMSIVLQRSAQLAGVGAVLFAVATAPAAAQCELQWVPGEGVPGVIGQVEAVTSWDPDGAGPAGPLVVVGGNQMTIAGKAFVGNVAAYDPATGVWSRLGNMIGAVEALAVLTNGDLVAAGREVVRWNPMANTWTLLGVTDAQVTALAAMPNGDLVAGGRFTRIDSVAAGRIARWRRATGTWTELGGMNNPVDALVALPGGMVVAGGQFTQAGSVPVNYVAAWDDAARTWNALAGGTNGWVKGLLRVAGGGPIVGDDIVAAGAFTLAGGAVANGIARWHWATRSWLPIGVGLAGNFTDLAALPNGDVLAAGNFAVAVGGAYGHGIARWHATAATWARMEPGISMGDVHALASLPGGDVVAASYSWNFANIGAVKIARWSYATNTWSRLGTGFNAFIGALLTLPNGDIVAGGAFRATGDVLGESIARWNAASSTWSRLGPASGPDGRVLALTRLLDGDVVAGGDFTMAGGQIANNLVRWDAETNAWERLRDGVNATVNALATCSNGDVVAGGEFTMAGVVDASRVARWNPATNAWSPLGDGLNGTVEALAVLPNGNIVAGGSFTMSGSAFAKHGAIWSAMQRRWSLLGPGVGLNGVVRAVTALPTGDVVVGGEFTLANGVATNHIARWNAATDTWSRLGDGLNDSVFAITVLPNGDLIVGGVFTAAGGLLANQIARWHAATETWSALGAGTSSPGGGGAVLTLATLPAGEVVVGGMFSLAGGIPSANFARLTTNCRATRTDFGVGCTGTGGANVMTSNLPWIGTTFVSMTTGLAPMAFAAAVTGFAELSPLPLQAVLPQALPGCDLLVWPDYSELVAVVEGTAIAALRVPNNVALVGLRFSHQLVTFELDSIGIERITSSNGLALTIGSF